MNLLKIVSYNLLCSKVFNFLLFPIAYVFVKIKNDKRIKNTTSKIILTIDCESGYLKQNSERVWMFQDPQAFQGYYFGINNILDLLYKYDIKATFFLSTQCFSSNGKIQKLVISTLTRLINEGHELGLHLHPKEDYALQKACKIEFKYTGARYYNKKTIELMIIKSKLLIKKHLGQKIADAIVSFRWANFALDISKINSIAKYFKIDSSICPNSSGHINDDRKYNWTNYSLKYIHKINNIIEAPLSTFWFFGWRRADPSLGFLTEIAFRKFFKSNNNPFIILTHSTECTYKNGRPTNVVVNLKRFVMKNIKKDIEYITLKNLINNNLYE